MSPLSFQPSSSLKPNMSRRPSSKLPTLILALGLVTFIFQTPHSLASCKHVFGFEQNNSQNNRRMGPTNLPRRWAITNQDLEHLPLPELLKKIKDHLDEIRDNFVGKILFNLFERKSRRPPESTDVPLQTIEHLAKKAAFPERLANHTLLNLSQALIAAKFFGVDRNTISSLFNKVEDFMGSGLLNRARSPARSISNILKILGTQERDMVSEQLAQKLIDAYFQKRKRGDEKNDHFAAQGMLALKHLHEVEINLELFTPLLEELMRFRLSMAEKSSDYKALVRLESELGQILANHEGVVFLKNYYYLPKLGKGVLIAPPEFFQSREARTGIRIFKAVTGQETVWVNQNEFNQQHPTQKPAFLLKKINEAPSVSIDPQ